MTFAKNNFAQASPIAGLGSSSAGRGNILTDSNVVVTLMQDEGITRLPGYSLPDSPRIVFSNNSEIVVSRM